MYRLFVAIDPPIEVKQRLLEICFGLPGAKWTDESRMHLTLRFIGEVDGARFDDISRSLAKISCEPFEVTVNGVDYSSTYRIPDSLQALVAKNDELSHLQKKVETALMKAGVGLEKRHYRPHINLARLKDSPAKRLAGFVVQHALLWIPPFKVTEFILYSSFLSSERALHQVEAVYPLIENRR